MSIRDRLQVILITFNRCEHAKRTLDEILDPHCPLHDFDITVLDNNSTDGTWQMVEDRQRQHANVSYRKNPYNIGIGGNIARAMEIATGEYLWIICDDDIYHWEHWHQVESAIAQEEDIICVSLCTFPREKLSDTAYKLLQLTFVPSIVFKRKLFNDTIMRSTFDNAFTLFPHLVPVVAHINHGGDIYVINDSVVVYGGRSRDISFTRGVAESDLFHRTRMMSFHVGYANIIANIKDKEIAKQSFRVLMCGKHNACPPLSVFLRDMFLHMNGKENSPMVVDVANVSPFPLGIVIKVTHFLSCTPLHWLVYKSGLHKAIKALFDLATKSRH